MKRLILLLFFLSFFLGHAQESLEDKEYFFWRDATCENGTEKAQENFNKGQNIIFLMGFISSTKSEDGFYEFYNNYILEKYHIKFIMRGCVIYRSIKCYNETMNKLVKEKYGNDIFDKMLIEAKNEFDKK